MFPALSLYSYISPEIKDSPGSMSIMYVDEFGNLVVSTVIQSAGQSAGQSLQESACALTCKTTL